MSTEINYEALEKFLNYLKSNEIEFHGLIRDVASEGGIKFVNSEAQIKWGNWYENNFKNS